MACKCDDRGRQQLRSEGDVRSPLGNLLVDAFRVDKSGGEEDELVSCLQSHWLVCKNLVVI